MVTGYLAANFDLFFSRFNNILIQSESYVTKRQSIKLLGELLLDRANYNVMMAYVESGENLKLCMKLLRDDRKMVQYEGFHVFKVCIFFFFASFHEVRLLVCANQGMRLCRSSWQTQTNQWPCSEF